jgi:hypothetical protein
LTHTTARTIGELYSEIIDAAAGEGPLPSCSTIEALEHQEPDINQVLTAIALAMLGRLFHYGRLSHHGAFFNGRDCKSSQIVDIPPPIRAVDDPVVEVIPMNGFPHLPSVPQGL